jgi:hypothetical protein
MFMKRKDLIVKLGNEFEIFVANAESICEEIKIALHEEIADHTISSRDIERYCPDNWKKKTKPQKKDNLSFLTKIEDQEKEEQKTIVIDTAGSLVDEPKPIDTKSQICINESNYDVETQEISTNIENNTKNLHTCPNCKQPLLENQRIAYEKDIKIRGLQSEIQQLYHDLNVKRSENAGLQTQLDHFKKQLQVKDDNDVNDINMISASNAYHQLEGSPIVDLEFTLRYEEVQRYVSSKLKITGVLGPLWFNCRLDKRTFRIVSAYPGSIVERESMANKEDNRIE